METETHTYEGHEYEVAELSREGAYSVICLDPEFGEDDIDYTPWPDTDVVSEWIGKPVGLPDAGDSPRGVEAIYTVKRRN